MKASGSAAGAEELLQQAWTTISGAGKKHYPALAADVSHRLAAFYRDTGRESEVETWARRAVDEEAYWLNLD